MESTSAECPSIAAAAAAAAVTIQVRAAPALECPSIAAAAAAAAAVGFAIHCPPGLVSVDRGGGGRRRISACW